MTLPTLLLLTFMILPTLSLQDALDHFEQPQLELALMIYNLYMVFRNQIIT